MGEGNKLIHFVEPSWQGKQSRKDLEIERITSNEEDPICSKENLHVQLDIMAYNERETRSNDVEGFKNHEARVAERKGKKLWKRLKEIKS